MSSPLEEAFLEHVMQKRGIALGEQWHSDVGYRTQFEAFKAGVEYTLQNALSERFGSYESATRCCPRCKTTFYGGSLFCSFKCYVEDEGYE